MGLVLKCDGNDTLIRAVSAKPLSVSQVFTLTGGDAVCKMDDYYVRIMNFSPGQTIEVEAIIEWKGLQWGIKKLDFPRTRYQYFAFLVDSYSIGGLSCENS